MITWLRDYCLFLSPSTLSTNFFNLIINLLVFLNTCNYFFLHIFLFIFIILTIIALLQKYNIISKDFSITFIYFLYVFSIFYMIMFAYYSLLDLFSKVLLLLVSSVIYIVLTTLGSKTKYYTSSAVYLYVFIPITYYIVQTYSLVELFILYEFLMVPSVFLLYTTSYSRKSTPAILYFILWTQFGSLLVFIFFITLVTCYSKDLFNLHLISATVDLSKNKTLHLLILFGLGFKIPIYPLHRWLIYTHVEASSGFSIFLSGFLVKIALWLYYKLSINLNLNTDITYLSQILAIFGITSASIHFWIQTDLKKLIAYATVQEMNMIFFLLSVVDQKVIYIPIMFTLAHGFLSTLMFYTVELIYRRFYSRHISALKGVWQLTPNLAKIIFVKVFLFIGIPGTVKFSVEYMFFSYCLLTSFGFGVFVFVVVSLIGVVGYVKIWFSVLFSVKKYETKIPDISTHELFVCIYLIVLNIFLNIFFIIYNRWYTVCYSFNLCVCFYIYILVFNIYN